ncbi:Transposase DDE domain protein [Posidoniimonas polymericola]|uniref:Transposase DDE domain protein n=1 Tax=Posidoniimonas polymericola TaxID=2528002 RepID=A0A5C5YLM7_9BACT|nr:ISAs1 family transposase [Posidoniimonas polymericola]TWT75851.1 Transposase DDE domain protein [Posidoniimonas polymericola]
MSAASLCSLAERLGSLPDPRSEVNRLHLLGEVVVIAVCGVIVGAEGPTAIHRWADAKRDWLGGFLTLPRGLPSKDCIQRVLSLLRPEAFTRCFSEWVAENLSSDAAGRLIAIDGKTLRRSHDKKKGLGAMHIVSAWASEEGLSLGQLVTDEKSNEITAIPELLENISVQDGVVTIDAMGCQKEIAKKIIDAGGDYVLALKGNHEKLHAAVAGHFEQLHEEDFQDSNCRRRQTKEKVHGRLESRYYYHTPLQPTAPTSTINECQIKSWLMQLTRPPPGRQPGCPPTLRHRPPQATPRQTQPQREAANRRMERQLPRRTTCTGNKLVCAGPAVRIRTPFLSYHSRGDSSRSSGVAPEKQLVRFTRS